MNGYLYIFVILAGVASLSNSETYGDFLDCQKTAAHDCAKSNPTFQNPKIQISRFFLVNSVCEKRQDFSKLLVCSIDAEKSCLTGDDQKLVATESAYISAIDYFCSRFENETMDIPFITCLEKSKCLKAKDNMLSGNSSIAEYKVSHCSKMESLYACFKDDLTSCPKLKETLMEIVKLIKPEACSGTSIFYNSILIFFSLYLFKFFM